VVLTERARGVIRDYLASLDRVPPEDQFLFQSRKGPNRPISRTQAHLILKGICWDCGIDATRISTHSLRKSFVRAVYDASGHDLVGTQKIVMHASPLTTASYLESTQTELDDLVLGLGAPAPVPAAAHSLALAS
jgi:site-specific recombinase XerD